ncbi:MAG: alpha/beta hydrolase [Desulfovibrionaceae bacterium]
MLPLLKWLAALVGLGYFGALLAMVLFQNRLVFQPIRNVDADPAYVGLAYERLWLATEQGRHIEAWYVPATDQGADPGLARGSVLFCHGNGGNLSHRLETLVILNRLGMNCLIFDYQGYGNSEGAPSEQGTYADAQACWDWLVQERCERPERIVLMGRSLGGAVAAKLAETNTPAGLVLESTFTSVPAMGSQMYPWLPVRLLSRYRYDTLGLLPRLSCPVLVIHSPEDEIVPYQLGRELYQAFAGPKSFLQIMGGHNEGFLLTGPAYDQGLHRFFTDVLARLR